ncbi:MAG: uL15 family ribosomal protein [Candidatus Diapherotrites archaeon]|nr:uL15 family ribosomal protein [Candidatus Diapherotrites archaeon]
MPRKKRKINKHRGTRTCGRGKKGSRRKSSGKGMAGAHKHKWTWIIKNKPDHFGSESMKPIKKKMKAINIDYINELALTRKMKEIDVASIGYEKVLGRGKLSTPIKVVAKAFTAAAKEKIEKAGGEAIIKGS